MRNLITRFVREEDGMEFVEWALVATLFALAGIGAWGQIAGNSSTATRRMIDFRITISRMVAGPGATGMPGLSLRCPGPPRLQGNSYQASPAPETSHWHLRHRSAKPRQDWKYRNPL